MAPPDPRDLEALAALYGVQPTYLTVAKELRTAEPAAVLAVLRTLGAPVEGPGDVAGALRRARVERDESLLPPVVVVWVDDGHPAVDLAGSDQDAALRCRLVTEEGDTVEWKGEVLPRDGHLALTLPPDLPVGYHDLDVARGRRAGRCRVIVAPRRSWAPEGGGGRGWGVFLPLYALRTARTRGIADLTDLEALERWVARLGGEVVGMLPLLASFLDEPFEPSPYAPVSRLFWNELYLDPTRAPGWEDAPEAQRRLASMEGGALEDPTRVDYRAAARARRRVLEALAGSFAPADEPLPGALAVFAEERPEALGYARFRAAVERSGSWRGWSPAARDGALAEADHDEAAVRYHLYAQWAMDASLRGLSRSHAGLYLDLPLGTHADGYDVWRFRSLFAEGASAGAPPDPFFAGGQDWGIPPLHPARMREDRHAYWAASVRRLMSASAVLRLDHVMGLHRLYWVPRGFPATEGVYVRYPAEEMYAVLSVESHRARCELVGEDLGTVPDEVREAMGRHGLRRMYVVPFEVGGDDGDARMNPVPASAVASVGTHDMPPWAGFWDGVDVEERVEDGQLAEGAAAGEAEGRAVWRRSLLAALRAEGEEVDVGDRGAATALRAALRFLAASPARLVLISIEDLWGETEPQNRPGTAGGDNWRRRAAHPLEDIEGMAGVTALLAEVDALRRAAPRGARSRNDVRVNPSGSAAP